MVVQTTSSTFLRELVGIVRHLGEVASTNGVEGSWVETDSTHETNYEVHVGFVELSTGVTKANKR